MVFNDTTTKQGLLQDCEMILFNEYGKITDNSDLLFHFTHLLNRQYDKAVSIIIEHDGRWQYDDGSYTTTAIFDADLVSGQRNYTIDAEHLKVTMVRVKDNAGNYRVLRPIDQNDPEGFLLANETTPETTGQPIFYDKTGDQCRLYPTPNYSQAASLEFTVQRVPNYFVSGDTTKEAGIAPVYHRFLSLGAALDYAVVNSLAVKNDLSELYRDERERMVEFYMRRNRDESKYLRVTRRSSR